jgi:VWFA-related protein/TonB family protein
LTRRGLRACLCLLSLIALTLPAQRIGAQSGRHKPQTPAPSRPSTTTTTTRSRSVNSANAPREQSSPTPRASSGERIPSNPAALGEPPPFPTPTPAPDKAAAAKPDDEIDAADVVRINSNLVTVPASVLDASGRAVINLKLEDFELRVDGQPKTITDLGFADSPVRMAVLFDNSSSLVASREFEKQAAIRFFRSVLRPVDQAMIYSVSTVPTLEYPLTSDVQALVRTIEHFSKPEGATALFDAIVQAATYLKPHQEGRRVIVIVSDGADTISDLDFETTLRRAQAADCQIYAVQTGQIENANLHDLAAERRLQEFTSQTGGAVYVPRGTGDLDAAFAQIAADLAQQYVLSYYPEDEQKDGRFRTISVRVTSRPNLRVRARKGYYAVPGQKQAWLQGITTMPGGQTQLIAANNPASNLDQSANAANVKQDNGGRSNNAASVTASPVYLKTNNNAGVVRDRVGPRGPSDDSGGPTESKRAIEPDIIPPVASSNAPPPSSTGPSITTSSSTAASPASSPMPTPTASPSPTTSPTTSQASSTTQSPPPAASHSPAPSQKKSETAAESGSSTQSKPNTSRPASSAQSSAKSPAQPAENKTAPQGPVSGGVLNGKAVSLPKPVYPLAAKNIGVKGTVVVEVTLDETGKVIAARALSGHPLLLNACVNAARQARFSPTFLNGQAVKVLGAITYTFMQ